MRIAHFRILGSLRDFLPGEQSGTLIRVKFRGQQSIKHLVESLGVPHPEIGQVRINGREASLEAITQDGDQVEVFPVPSGCDIEPRFLLDNHLGRLAAHLRMLGFDCLYRNDYQDPELAHILEQDDRILLTRDRRLLMRKVVRYGYCPRSLKPLEQLVEVIQHFDLLTRITPFHRCLRCNHSLERVPKEAVLDRLEPLTKEYFDDFHICPNCQQVYWKGSHYERMQEIVKKLV